MSRGSPVTRQAPIECVLCCPNTTISEPTQRTMLASFFDWAMPTNSHDSSQVTNDNAAGSPCHRVRQKANGTMQVPREPQLFPARRGNLTLAKSHGTIIFRGGEFERDFEAGRLTKGFREPRSSETRSRPPGPSSSSSVRLRPMVKFLKRSSSMSGWSAS